MGKRKLGLRRLGRAARELKKLDEKYISSSYTRGYDFFMDRGEGAWVWDVDGNKFLDFTSGIGVSATGHNNKRVVAAIERAGKLRLVAGKAEILPGITVEQTGGHTRGHQGVRVESQGKTFVYYADIFPSRFHVKAPFVAAVDTYPLETLQFKKRLLKFCQEKDTIIGFDHDVEYLMGRLVQGKKWLDVGPV